ncbi:Exocyst complex component EXO70A1 [Zostera marina]|uniref:Exocyst subunit Exo70 family protein n=1 Tax=Zostera marina TaxID=29655 RepID=A0A0K9PX16_ZOSMR|nr:Exocyst complex component EXO70A1 [Zostera marina]
MGTIEILSQKAIFLRESLQKSQANTDEMVAILGSFDNRLSALEEAMRPTQVRTHAIRTAHETIDKTIKSAHFILEQYDLSRKAEAKILRGPHEDLESYIEAVDQLRNNIKFFTSNKGFKTIDGALKHDNSLLAKAIVKLEEEFKQLLSNYSVPVEPDRLFDCLPTTLRPSADSPHHHGDPSEKVPSAGNQPKNSETDVYIPPTLLPPRIIPLLRSLSQQLVQAGYQSQCSKIYWEYRSSALEQSLRKLGVEKLNKDDVQKMQWEVLEAKIGNWIHFMRIAVKLLFVGEKKVCDQIFDGLEPHRELCFAEVTGNSVSILLSFGDAIARSKRSPEKLFVILDMYEVMRELHSEIQDIFISKSCLEMRETAMSLTKRLSQTAQEIFGDFEEAVEKDVTKSAVLDGTVHPLTSYVINYVKFLFDYQATLRQLFQEVETKGESSSQLGAVTARIMQALQNNLDGKAKQYKDPSLTYLFLMNNVHYIVKSVRKSEANDFLGDDWVQRHRRVVQQHANQYKRVAWAKILQTLTIQSPGSGSGTDTSGSSGVSRVTVKERFKSFNLQFEDLHQRQSQWTVPDQELRESLRLSVAEILLPAYRSFHKRYGPLIDSGKNPQKYIKYVPEDLDRMLAEFFDGKTWNEQKR